jgi:hypothetical protein
VYLLQAGCDWQVGINIIAWFFFITPGMLPSHAPISQPLTVAYLHGFGLLAYRKLWPRIKPQVEEFTGNFQAKRTALSLALLTGVEVSGDADGNDPLKNAKNVFKEKAEDVKEVLTGDAA